MRKKGVGIICAVAAAFPLVMASVTSARAETEHLSMKDAVNRVVSLFEPDAPAVLSESQLTNVKFFLDEKHKDANPLKYEVGFKTASGYEVIAQCIRIVDGDTTGIKEVALEVLKGPESNPDYNLLYIDSDEGYAVPNPKTQRVRILRTVTKDKAKGVTATTIAQIFDDEKGAVVRSEAFKVTGDSKKPVSLPMTARAQERIVAAEAGLLGLCIAPHESEQLPQPRAEKSSVSPSAPSHSQVPVAPFPGQ